MGLFKPIIITLTGSVLAIGSLLFTPDYFTFVVAVCAFNFLWNFGLPFVFTAVGNMDKSGTMVSFAIALQMTGLGFGPFLAALILGNDGGFREVEILIISLYTLCAFPLFYALFKHRTIVNQLKSKVL